jgi:hypothetical protein
MIKKKTEGQILQIRFLLDMEGEKFALKSNGI